MVEIACGIALIAILNKTPIGSLVGYILIAVSCVIALPLLLLVTLCYLIDFYDVTDYVEHLFNDYYVIKRNEKGLFDIEKKESYFKRLLNSEL